ncbi:MAG: exo-alpha-sialidase [Verrucomicrobia bacterium]|nr:exo-alpha-sialidase [Verrucomicrobiota bacterium]
MNPQNALWTALILLLAPSPATTAPAPAASSQPDPRNFANGRLIPDEGYCDQPRIVVTRDGTWVCLLTTGPAHEGASGQHIAATRSHDRGQTWSPLVEVESAQDPNKSSYALAFVTPGDRIWAIYCYNGDGINTLPDGKSIRDDMQGWLCARFSDDQGRSWSRRQRLPMRLTAADRSNDWQGRLQMFWATGTPTLIGQSVVFGFTKLGRYLLHDGEGWFYRSDNVLADPDPDSIQWQLLPDGDHGVRAPEFGSVQEEFDVVSLDGDDLFTVYRTALGHAACAYSRDGGHSWEKPDALRYTPGGRIMKHPRACAKIWKTRAGRYLLWYHHNGTTTYNNGPNAGSRNLAWLSAGTLRQGRLHWSQPELVAYVDGGLEGCSYPDLIEDGHRFHIAATQKTEARVLDVAPDLLDGLWRQHDCREVATRGLVLALAGSACAAGRESRVPKLPSLCAFTRERTLALHGRGGFTLETRVRFDDLAPGQVLLDARTVGGTGYALTTTERRTVRLDLCDGWRAASWETDPGLLRTNTLHHLVAIVDGGPKLIAFVLDGQLGDGGNARPFGFGRFDPAFKDVSGAPTLKLAPSLRGALLQVRLYNRALRVSEAVANFRAEHPETP